jgi:hypothetical protein
MSVAIALVAILVLAACSSDHRGTPVEEDTTDSTDLQTNQQANADTGGAPTADFVTDETCHTKKLAGGNSDALFLFSVGAPDGTDVTAVFDSSEQGLVVGEGVVKAKQLLVRIPVVAVGETLTLQSISNTADNSETIAPDAVGKLPVPALTVPDQSGSSCELDDKETAVNGTINQPNKNNNTGANAN